MSAPGVHYPHRIRLRGPWECVPLGPDAPAPRRMTMPCRWGDGGLPAFAGRVRFVRRFGYPGRIDDYERVWLTFAGVEGTADVTLNEKRLGHHAGDGPFEFDVTGLLGSRNELIVEVEADSDRGGLWADVALEVRRTAFLRDVRAHHSGGTLRVTGQVVGQSSRPLELYVLLDGVNVAYVLVEPSPEGRTFEVTANEIERAKQARVELVDAATVWYPVACDVATGAGVTTRPLPLTCPGPPASSVGGADP